MKINLIGAGGHGKVVYELALNQGCIIESIFDSNPTGKFSAVQISNISEIQNCNCIITIGDNKTRKIISEKLNFLNWVSFIHKSSIFSNNATISAGTVIMPGAIIQPGAQIGKHCIINSGAVIEHDCIIEDFVHVAPNSSLAGGVKVGEGSLIGIGSSIIPNIEIGSWTTIGAGSVVINDIPADSTAFGNPCRVKKHHEKK